MFQNFINKTQSTILALFVVALPLFYLPITPDFFEFNKQALLLIITLFLLFLSVLKIILTRKLLIRRTIFDLPLILLGILYILSTVFQSPYKLASMITPLGLITIVCALLLYFIINNSFENDDYTKLIVYAILGAGFILASVSLVNIFQNKSFSPLGSIYFAFLFLLIPLSYAASGVSIYIYSVTKDGVRKIDSWAAVLVLSFLLNFSALVLFISQFIKSGLVLLPLSAGWAIALETWKSLNSFLLGVGPGIFQTAFTLGRPIGLNTTPFWNLIFGTSSSFLLTLGTEVGLLSGLIFLYIFIRVATLVFKKNQFSNNLLLIPLLILLLIQIVTLSNVTLLVYTFILLAAVSAKNDTQKINLDFLGLGVWLLPIVDLILSAIILFFASRVYLAEIYFKKSIDAISQNKGQNVYDLQIKALKLNPLLDKYHISFSQTNLALANVIASKKELTDTDRQNIPQLIQQAITEARFAVTINRASISTWDNLGNIYFAIIRFADGAADWTIKSYQNEIALNPTDPQVRLTLGGVYYSLKRYDEAVNAFQNAVNLKPDWANARYNLSAAFREKKDYTKAFQEMQQTLALLPSNSNDRKKVQDELDKLKALLPAEATASATFQPSSTQPPLSLPSPLPSSFIITPTIPLAPPPK